MGKLLSQTESHSSAVPVSLPSKPLLIEFVSKGVSAGDHTCSLANGIASRTKVQATERTKLNAMIKLKTRAFTNAVATSGTSLKNEPKNNGHELT